MSTDICTAGELLRDDWAPNGRYIVACVLTPVLVGECSRANCVADIWGYTWRIYCNMCTDMWAVASIVPQPYQLDMEDEEAGGAEERT